MSPDLEQSVSTLAESNIEKEEIQIFYLNAHSSIINAIKLQV